MPVPDNRITRANSAPIRRDGEFILYWMIANRRPAWNFSLDRAIELAAEFDKPLVVFEALRSGYKWASDRLHAFVIEGMADNAAAFSKQPVTYYPYLEEQAGQGSGLLGALATRACAIVTDDFPCFFLPRMVSAAARRAPVRLEHVDSNGLWPMRATDRVFTRAHDFRRFLQKNLLPHLEQTPHAKPFHGVKLATLKSLPTEITDRWPMADPPTLLKQPAFLQRFAIDHTVGRVDTPGGIDAARARLGHFIKHRLASYGEDRNHPDDDGASGFSPYLHFGHLSVHQAFAELMATEDWTPRDVADKPNGSAHGWWGVSPPLESFLDELITWRELGYNICALRDDYDQYTSLPQWAKATLADHAGDKRQFDYSLEQFETAETHDEVWNAAQRQLLREGRMHNYLRMLWGKKILEWSPTPQAAFDAMVELNNKYALDGRNPNSYSGICWVLGRYDRPWGPERPIFGKIRYMSSDNTVRKLRMQEYLAKYAK